MTRRLFILRPEPGATESAARARAIGLEVVVVPLFDGVPVAWEVPDPAQFDGLLLTSANAVRLGGAGIERLRTLPVYAVGDATARAAHNAGFTGAGVGDGGLERLLGAHQPDLRLLHLCGEHRTAPDARQAITAIAVYRSSAVPAPDGLQHVAGHTVAIHSPRAGQRFAELVGEADRGSIRIAAISPAAAIAAGDGWERIEYADAPSDAALLALAARLCDNPRQQ